MFLAPEGDHYRRASHTRWRLPDRSFDRPRAQAERGPHGGDRARARLGHTPYGHTGESALTECLAEVAPRYPGLEPRYQHNVQSLRVVEGLEYAGHGLNLTWEVRDGIRHHTGETLPATLEAQIARTSDRIAYVNHDIDDAVRAGVQDEGEIPTELLDALGTHHGARITTLVQSMVRASENADRIAMEPDIEEAMLALRTFLFDRVYFSRDAKGEDPKAKELVKSLFGHYLENPDQLPEELRPSSDDELPQRVVDYVAGMTDRFAIRTFEQLFIPTRWRV